MKRKFLYALALLLALSTVAFSNERARYRCRTAGKIPCDTTTTSSNAATPATPATAAESHVLLHTFIKLLYI